MLFVKKFKFEIIFGIFIIALYFFLRFYHILSLPIFTDEAIYIRWSQIAKQDANWRFISLTDGKQPMFVWITMLLLRFIHDPLLAGRVTSVFAGFATTVGLFFLGKELFKNRWIGLLSAFLYSVFPFGLVYDRMALYDSLVAAFAVWGWYLTVVLVKKIRTDIAFTLGFILGGGMLTKTSDFFIAALMPFTMLLFDFSQKNWKKKFFQWVLLGFFASSLAFLFYSILRLSPFYGIISEKNAIFVYPFSEWIHHPFTFFEGNIRGLWDWFITYLKLPFLLLILGSFIYIKDFLEEKILVVIWFAIPFFYLAFFGKTLYPRFILFMTVPLLILAAYTIYKLTTIKKNVLFQSVLMIAFVGISLYTDYFILNDFSNAPIPQSDLGQYINDWPAGGGVAESVQFFKEQAATHRIFIATEGTFGLMPYALEISLVDNPNIQIKGYWPVDQNPPQEVMQKAKIMPTYYVFYQPCIQCSIPGIAPSAWPLQLEVQYPKKRNRLLSIYRVVPR